MNMDKVKEDSKKFMERKYTDEAPYFDIAWEIFEEIMKGEKDEDLDLKGPIVRFEGDDTIMAPMVIRAFYTLYSEIEKEIESGRDLVNLKPLMMEVLSGNNFSPEFSTKVIDFVVESWNYR